ncbi:MAG: biopolymer transporter ExbD [Opitutales bacterium]|jgi:biopolymer transport protein ExbD
MKQRFSRKVTAGDEINMSPLIDMVFILLIFFIVSTTFVEESGVTVDKPEAVSASQLEKKSIILAITSQGKVMYGGRDIGTAGVRGTVRRILRKTKMPVIIQADKTVPTELLVHVLDEVKMGGAERVSIATEVE